MNRQHIWPVRASAACVGGLIALVSTGRLGLARELFGQFYNGFFKLGGRRTGFYLYAGWMKRKLAHDPFFNFTEGMSPNELSVLSDWILSRRNALSIELFSGHMMLLEAAHAHWALETDDQDGFEAHLKQFKHYADLLLGNVVENDDVPVELDADVRDTPGFVQNAAEVLRDFERDLPIEQWRWFVVGGTFLGLVRDKDFMPHDVDLDVGLFLDDLDLVAFEAVFENSDHFSIAKFDYQTEIYRDAEGHAQLRRVPAMLKIVHSNGVNLDVFLHERRDGKIWHGSGVNKWVNAPFKLAPYEIKGQKVLGPDDADHYLREHYGEWRVVVKNFSCITGTTNLAFVKNLHTIAVLLKRYAHFSKARPAEAKKVLRELREQGYIEINDGTKSLSNHIV